MLAISSIVGSLNGPISQLIEFVREMQDAKISLARLSEIHNKEDETQQELHQTNDVSFDADIDIKNLSYRYLGSDIPVLEDFNLKIPANKVTAIVGVSGSGKTTLMKLLLKFYEPEKGEINIGNTQLKNISQKAWRANIGAVMQEGFIFSDTIANNIAIGVDKIDKERLLYAADVANMSANKVNPELKLVDLYFFARRSEARRVVQVIHCGQHARADFSEQLDLPLDNRPVGDSWQKLSATDPLMLVVCQSS